MGQHFPLTACALHIEDAIEDLSEINFYWMSKALGFGHQWLQDLPLGVAQVTRVRLAGRIGNFR